MILVDVPVGYVDSDNLRYISSVTIKIDPLGYISITKKPEIPIEKLEFTPDTLQRIINIYKSSR